MIYLIAIVGIFVIASTAISTLLILPWWSSVSILVVFGSAIIFLSLKLIEAKRRTVEMEMTNALGLSPPSRQESDSESEIDASLEDATHQPSQQPNRTSYAQHIEINITGERTSAEIVDLVRQQSDGHARLVIKYYAQGHSQASISFLLSMTFAVAGFAMIAIAIVQVLRQPEQLVTAGITGLVGIVNQAVSVLFFQRADKGRDLMTQLIDKLRADRESELKFVAGLAAIEQVKSSGLRDTLRAAAALAFTGSAMNLDQLANLLNSGALTVEATQTPSINVFGPQGQSASTDSNGRDPSMDTQKSKAE